MLPVYSPHGCPGDFFFCDTNKKIKLIIDPNPQYFTYVLPNDRKSYDLLVLIQGMEPKEINNISDEVIRHHHQFDKILTSYPEVLSQCQNAELFLYASCWILTRQDKTRANHRTEYHNIFSTEKKFLLSHVMSNKNYLLGHQLRHQTRDIINKPRRFELYFPPSIEMEKKYQLFENSMFHIAIENTKNVNYISEKIIDCFMSYTIPIYWGCPNIGDYFNTDGIIFFETKEELDHILNNLSEDDYFKRLEAVIENYNITNTRYAFYSDRVNAILDTMVN
jgi:hypothetical protein